MWSWEKDHDFSLCGEHSFKREIREELVWVLAVVRLQDWCSSSKAGKGGIDSDSYLLVVVARFSDLN